MSSSNQSPSDIAWRLAEFYRREFGGKKSGRYLITREKLLLLSNRQRLTTKFFEDVRDILADKHDLIMMDAGRDSYLVEHSLLINGTRPIPSRFLLQGLDNG